MWREETRRVEVEVDKEEEEGEGGRREGRWVVSRAASLGGSKWVSCCCWWWVRMCVWM